MAKKMAKTKVLSIRVTEEMNLALTLLAQNIYKQDTQDIYRIALSNLLIQDRKLLREVKETLNAYACEKCGSIHFVEKDIEQLENCSSCSGKLILKDIPTL